MSELLLHRFEMTVARRPQAVALRVSGVEVAYGDLNARANAVAAALLEDGALHGEVVGLCAPPSVELIAGMIGILKAGCAWAALDPAGPESRLGEIVAAASISRILAEGDTLRMPAGPVQLDIGAAIAKFGDAEAPAVNIGAADLCYVMFTSGSTGVPNGVEVTHGNIAGLFDGLQEELAFAVTDRWSALHAFTFGYSVWEVWGALSTGASLEIIPAEARREPANWMAQLLEAEVSILSITPSGFRQLLAADCLPLSWSSLRLVVFSGEAINADDLAVWHARYGAAGPRLVNTYALTETGGRISWLEYEPDQTAAEGSIGRPVKDAEVLLLDDDLRPAASGATGELFVSGPMLARGYLNNPELTAQRFLWLDRDGERQRFYRTGDRARQDEDGQIIFVGRRDDQIKLRGHRIELGEIERRIRQHPEVQDAAVVLHDAGAAQQLCAFVVSQAGGQAGSPGVEFWPSLGEYQIYDELLYDFMSADEVRVASYRRALEGSVKDKVVLDIGTGKDAILARLAASAGARKVYAVEVLEDACLSARRLVEQLGLAERIEILEGDMHSVVLPEPIDVCTQGIVGNIGSSDGIVPIWNAARNAFADEFTAVPSACTTLLAPAELPGNVRENAAFGSLAAHYTRSVFDKAGHSFDVRLCVRNFPVEGMLAEPAVFEELDFNGPLNADYSDAVVFVAERAGSFDGFLLWTKLQTGADEHVDFLAHQQAWLPVWFPLADEPVAVGAGDRIEARWVCTTPAGQIFPDYEIVATIIRTDGSSCELSYSSRHFESGRGKTELHRQLLESLENPVERLEDWLREGLPAHMQPTQWRHVDALPLNSSGKLDRRSLRDLLDSSELAGAEAESNDPLQRAITAIWSDVLGRPIGPGEDFFEAGGDSILAVRLTTEIQRFLDEAVFLAALFDAPTVESYTNWLREHHAEAVERSEAQLKVVKTAALVPGVRDASPVSLAYPQQSLWFLQQLYPDNTGANEQFLIRIHGDVDTELLRNAWQEMLSRHDVLRTYFADGEHGQAVQIPLSIADCMQNDPVPAISLTHLDPDKADRELESAARSSIAEVFDLARAPLLRTHIYELPEQQTVLLVTAHHIIADGMCVQLIRDELAALYGAVDRPQPHYQYADFARWQRNEPIDEVALDWWRTKLDGHTGQPTTVAHSADTAEGRERRFKFELQASLADGLRDVARQAGATPFMLLLAAWRVWLGRCLMEQDLLLGSPVTLRRDEATANMLGCMVNNVVLRNPLVAESSFMDVLGGEREAVLQALEHSHVPFEKVVEALQPERQLGRHPLFQLMFLFEDRSSPPVSAGDLEFRADVLPVDRASYWDLELSVTDCGVGKAMEGFIGVREDIHDADALEWWADGITSFLAAIVADPQCKVSDLPLLSSGQRKRILVDWNDTEMAIGPEQTLHDMVRAQAERTPEAVAVAAGDRCFNYRELMALADELADGLIRQGVAPGDLVGLCVQRGVEAIALQLAILRCGAAWLPLDPGYPEARLKLMVEDARPVLIVRESSAELGGKARCMNVAELRAGNPESPTEFPAVSGDAVAYALYTSGSSGVPKGVLATHASAVSRCRWMWREFDFSPADVFGQRTSLNFVDSVWEIFGALGHGACVDVLPTSSEQDPAAIMKWLHERGISHIALVPPLLRALLDSEGATGRPDSLHTLISSGEALSPELAARLHNNWPNCRLLNTYGTSETWDVSCFEVARGQLRGLVPIGRPVANASLCVLDERMQPVPPGVEGELYAGGLGLAREYLGKPELTAAQFVSNPLKELRVKRLYKTGDRARYRGDGNVELLGRADRQIKLRGVRIEAGDIEAQVLQREDIRECAVILRTAADAGEWLALYIVPVGPAPDSEELRLYLRARLPHAMVPADICVLEQLPLTPSGKVDADALPRNADVQLQSEYTAPRNELEKQLCHIWCEALNRDAVGVHDNFFALRGHSLLATQVIARIGEEQQLEIPLQFIFESPTVAGLARSIEALQWASQGGGGQQDDGGREVVRL